MSNLTVKPLIRILNGIALLAIAMLCVGPVSAQTTETAVDAGTSAEFNTNVFGVGLSASLCSGMGLTFRHHIAKIPLAYQITGGIWKSGGVTLGDIGAEIQYDLSVSTNRLYAVAGGGYYPVNFDASDTKSPTRFGVGIGYEQELSKSVGLYGNLMITFFQPSGDILPLPSLGLLVFFK